MSIVRSDRPIPRGRDDSFTRQAVAYLRSRTSADDNKVAKRLQTVHAAHTLHATDPTFNLVLQARLLAGQLTADIAAATGIAPDVVNAYEALFFSVRDHLDSRDWIAVDAIQWTTPNSKGGRAAGTVLKAMAYHGGPILLEAVLPFFVPQCRPAACQTDQLDSLRTSIPRTIEIYMAPLTSAEFTRKALGPSTPRAVDFPTSMPTTRGEAVKDVLDRLKPSSPTPVVPTNRRAENRRVERAG